MRLTIRVRCVMDNHYFARWFPIFVTVLEALTFSTFSELEGNGYWDFSGILNIRYNYNQRRGPSSTKCHQTHSVRHLTIVFYLVYAINLNLMIAWLS